MSTPLERVAEYVRQRKMQNKDLGNVIHGVYFDPAAEMADLTLPDLEDILELAERYEDLADS